MVKNTTSPIGNPATAPVLVQNVENIISEQNPVLAPEDNEPSDSEYDTAEKELDIYFEKIKNPYINRKSEVEKFNEGEGYYAEDKLLAFFESIEEKITDIYKKELTLKSELKIEDEILQESALNKPQLGLINLQNRDDIECFKWCINAYLTKEEVIKANRKSHHLNEIQRLRQNANIANFNNINFLATLHDIDKFKKINPNYAINIFRPVYRETFRKIIVDIDPLHILE
ncbi:2892_t:CDS:2 [Diversispora eburnea]|uniref:2892_t:CDS:1 n=1 Tax=Diversispora eburnea TaxID=1213867 RepID=A0A9N9CN21_9GLOM|nr:2892_t:CDS:2 [Diversispora eburnea]